MRKKASPDGLAFLLGVFGGLWAARTPDRRIKSPLLYQLS